MCVCVFVVLKGNMRSVYHSRVHRASQMLQIGYSCTTHESHNINSELSYATTVYIRVNNFLVAL